ncbi:MAG: putative glycoside hydrolase [Patescibacteria group bacterium]
MKKILLFFTLFLFSGLTLIGVRPVSAAESPYLKMHGKIFENISRPRFLDNLTAENPLYLFSNPFVDTSILTSGKIQEIHSRLPQIKVILHLLCCTLFDNKEVDSIPPGKIHADLQNSQGQFDNFWTNHRDAFMKNSGGGYVYYKIEKTGNYWFYEGDGHLMDPANSFYQNFLYGKIKHYIDAGYDGVYLDLMYPNFMQKFYYSKPFINGHAITRDEWNSKLISLSRSLQDRKNNDPDPTMKKALIITNSVGGGPGDGSDPVDRIQFNRDLQTQGVQIENPFADYRTMTTGDWLGTVNRIRDITALRNNQLRGWLNFHASEQFPNQEECDRHGLFTYASYLLGNQSPLFAFQFECAMGPGIHTEPTQNLTRIRLGNPVGPYRQTSFLYRRDYDNGLVLVNPTDTQRTYQPAVPLFNPYTSAVYPANSTIHVATRSGLVLLKNPARNPADLTDEGDTPGNQVNIYDYNLLVADFGKTGSPGFIAADIIKDGRVDIFDYNILVENFER